MSTFAWAYGAIALSIGGIFYWRNRSSGAGLDAEFFFLCAGVAFLWPLSIGLDLYLWWKDRQR